MEAISGKGGEQAGSRRAARLLVVDDEPLVCRLIERALGQQHEVTVVTSAQAALDRILAGERFDLVLCDLMMPEMTGMDLHERVERIDADQAARMVFLTGGAFTGRASAFLERQPYLEKPFDLRSLEALVKARVGG